MPNIDSLSIQISADASNATRNINSLVKALERLNAALGSLDTSHLETFSRVVNDLASSVDNLNRGTESVRETAKAFKDLGKAASSVNRAKKATEDLAESSTGLSVIGNNITDVANVSNVLEGIFGRLISSFAGLSGGSQKLIGDADIIETTFREVTDVVYELTTACYTLMSAFTQVMSGFAALSGSTQNLIGEANIIDTTFREIQEPIALLGTAAESVGEFSEEIGDIDPANLNSVSDAANNVSINLGNALNKVGDIRSSLKGIFVPTKEFEKLEDQINKVADKYNELRQKFQEGLRSGEIEVDSEQFRKMAAELNALRNKYDELILKQRQLAQEGNAIRLNPAVERTLGSFKSGFTAVTNVVKNGFVAGIRSANSVLKSFRTRLKETASSLKNTITSGHKATDMAKKFVKELTRVGKMLKLMVTRMALRAVIKEVGNGFKSLALHSEEFNQSVSSMMNASKQLGYSFAAMVSPLVKAFAPAIVYVINLLIKLANAIQQVFASLTGASTWERAKEFTDDWGKSIEDANKEAKKLKKTVLGFDELNQLQEKTTGGDTSKNIEDMFETVKVDNKWKKLADWLKEMWELGDFYDLGKKLGEKLRDMLEAIPWEQMRETANKLGRSLASLINGFIEVERLGYDIGKTIAQSVNTVFEFLNGFVHKLHWDSIGKFIAETFNGFFETIDWALIKDTVTTGMAGIAEALQNFIETFHWDNISNFIINAIDVIVSGIKKFVEGVDWRDLGEKMGDQLRKTINGIDWKDVGEALGEIIQAAIDWVAGVLDTMPSAEELVQAATDFLDGLFDKVDSQQLGEEVATILNGVYNFLVGFWAENGDKIKEEVKSFFKGFWEKIDKNALKNVLGALLKVAILGGIAAAGWTAIKTYFANKFAASITAKALSKVLGGKIAAGVTEAATGEVATGAATTAGASLGTTIAAGLLAAFAGQQIGTEIGKMIFPEDSELYDQYKGISGFFKEIKDIGVGTVDWIKMAWSGEAAEGNFFTSLSKEEQNYYSALKVHYGQEFPQLWEETVAKMGSGAEAWKALKGEGQSYFEETQAKLKKMSEEQTNATKAYSDNAEKMKGANQEVKDSLKGLDENSLLYKKLAEEMEETTKQAKNVVEESRNVSTAYKGPTEAVEKYKKQTEESSKTTNEWVEKHRQSKQEWDKLKDSLDKTTTSTTSNQKALSDLSKTTQETTKDIKVFTDSISKEAEASDKEFTTAIGDMIKVQGELSKSTEESVKFVAKTWGEGTKNITSDFDIIKSGMTREKWTFQGVADGLGETFRRAREAIKKEWNQIADTLNGEHTVATEKIKIDLPKFATGGFPEDGWFRASHGEIMGRFDNGQSVVANNTQIVEGISAGVYNAVSSAMARSNSGGERYIANTIVVDGEVIARTVTRAQERQQMRYSPVTI